MEGGAGEGSSPGPEGTCWSSEAAVGWPRRKKPELDTWGQRKDLRSRPRAAAEERAGPHGSDGVHSEGLERWLAVQERWPGWGLGTGAPVSRQHPQLPLTFGLLGRGLEAGASLGLSLLTSGASQPDAWPSPA